MVNTADVNGDNDSVYSNTEITVVKKTSANLIWSAFIR
jgi:hypothetical protein